MQGIIKRWGVSLVLAVVVLHVGCVSSQPEKLTQRESKPPAPSVIPKKVEKPADPIPAKKPKEVKKATRLILGSGRAFLGVGADPSGSEQGLLVGRVVSGSAAEQAGFKPGDIITQLGEQKIGTMYDLLDALKGKKPGDEVKIDLLREGTGDKYEEKEFVVKLGERKGIKLDSAKLAELMQRLGQGGGLKPSTSYLGVSPDSKGSEEGYLVGQVDPGSPADKAGLKPGDIIIELDWDPVKTREDLKSALEHLDLGEEIEIVIIRDGKEIELTAKLARKSQSN